MKKTHFFTALLAGTALIVSCGNAASENDEPAAPAYDELHAASWLLGRWENNSEQGNLSEVWSELNDSTYSGNSCFVIPTGDTVFSEEIRLHQSGKDVWYTVTIADQNNGEPVGFRLTKTSDRELLFENREHDYPQQIRYRLDGKTLTATISGKQDGKEMKEDFVMTRK